MTAGVGAQGAPASVNALWKAARTAWAGGQSRRAVETAWRAFDLDPADGDAKRLLVALLWNYPAELSSERQRAFLGLLADRDIDPISLSPAGWNLVLRNYGETAAAAVNPERIAAAVGADDLALALLRETPVSSPDAERLLTQLRRWLLLSGEWRNQLDLVSALTAQARLNGGAWPFDALERARLEADADAPVAAYLPRPPLARNAGSSGANPVTQAVAEQYEDWPYPVWTRFTRPRPRRLPDVIGRVCPTAAQSLPLDARMLIAGCGTGLQAAALAVAYPDVSVTAIDISQASLHFAATQCAALGVSEIEFLKLDLHEAERLGRSFDVIFCSGVLHHLPDPERGLAAITRVLRPGGVMNIAVYTRVARLFIAAARSFIGDLAQAPMSDDVLREVRRRFLGSPEHPLMASIAAGPEFPTLAGVHDLLLHRHEDPFDIPRIERALEGCGLRLLSFQLPTPFYEAQYAAMFPGDPKRRDFDAWRAFEVRFPRVFAGMTQFWCQKPAEEASLI
jgi:SAM-dependent methyltransferase